jgi:Domain of unknown function (DUF4200)
MDKKIKLP